MSITANPTGAQVNKTVLISGTLTRSPKGSAVTVQRKSGASWVTAKAGRTTTAAGKYAVRVAVGSKVGTFSYRTVAAAKGTLKAATSRTIKVSALKPVSATIKATPTTINAGASSTLSGTVKPFVKNTVVSFQKFVSGKWISSGLTAVLNTKGAFSRSVPVKDSTIFRVSVPRAALNASAVSVGTAVITNPVISSTSLPHGAVGDAYTAQLTQVGSGAGTWGVTPTLPAGLALNTSTGKIIGTPTGLSNANYQFSLAQPGLTTAKKTLNLTVTTPPPPTPPTISTTSLPDGRVGDAYSTTLTAAGNPAGTWSATGLPAGLNLNTGTGAITGTPTVANNTNAVTIGFTQTSTGLVATPKNLNLKVSPPPPPPAPVISTTVLPDANGALLASYSAQLTAVGNPAGTWSMTGLPTGFSVNASGAISKNTLAVTPNGTYPVTINFTATGNPTPALPVHLTLTVGSHTAVASAGGQTSCRIAEDQTLSCWGDETSGQLGIGGTFSFQAPPELKPAPVAGTGWTAISESGGSLPGHQHGCGIRAAVAYCWGDDSSGQRGDGTDVTTPTEPRPVVGGAIWSALDSGFENTCAVTTTGALYCWGDNAFGQLGLGNAEVGNDKTVPTRVGTDNDWKQVTVGYTGACAVKTTGALYCWGFNVRGQLGTGTKVDQASPTQVGTDTNWANLSNGEGFTCAVKTTGTLWCWGPAGDGELGNGVNSNDPNDDQVSPHQVGVATDWDSVSAADSHACATTTTGQVWCWGANEHGQVGDNTVVAKLVPTRVGSATDWGSVSAGGNHSCAVKTSGAVWCWGSNATGELGINQGAGATPFSKVPVAVVG